MRIVGGTWRGRAIEAPLGKGTRPTTDRTRESMASMLLSAFGLDLSDVRVLDAFAGSGAIGLELLSRGAQSLCAIERDRRAASVVRRNARSLGAEGDRCAVVCGDAFRLAEGRPLPFSPFSLVILDPPYAYDAARLSSLVEALGTGGQLERGAVVLYERDASAPSLRSDALCALSTKLRGTTAVDLLRFGENDEH